MLQISFPKAASAFALVALLLSISACTNAGSLLTPVSQRSSTLPRDFKSEFSSVPRLSRNTLESVPTPTVRTKASLAIHIRIPYRRPHDPHYLSAASRGITFAFSGPSDLNKAFGLTPKSSGCSSSSTSVTCTFVFSLTVGSYRVDLVTYDAAPKKGKIPSGAHALSTAHNVAVTVARGKANLFKVTLSGVPAAFTIVPPSGTAGTAFTSPELIAISVKDADGYTIVGTYANVVTLADDDASGATTIATTGSDHPPANELISSNDAAALNYTGLAITPANISASASGATSSSAKFAPALKPIVITTSDALNPSFVGVDLYATSGAGSSGSFTVSEAGWTSAPYDRSLTVTPGNGCASIGSVQQLGNSFTASVANAPAPGTCTIVKLSDPFGQAQPVTLAYTNFAYTGGSQPITLPPSVTMVTVLAYGASGGGAPDGGGGLGGSVAATLPVAAGSLSVLVGGAGGNGSASTGGGGGYGGGGASLECGCPFNGSGGGGASSVLQGGSTLVVAGGGGGEGGLCDSCFAKGGDGGYPAGMPGASGLDAPYIGGGGANQSMGGTGTADGGANGGRDQGGYGDSGGGGGYYGGGGSGEYIDHCPTGLPPFCGSPNFYSGGGGGGSSYYGTAATNVTTSTGTHKGNGVIVIIW